MTTTPAKIFASIVSAIAFVSMVAISPAAAAPQTATSTVTAKQVSAYGEGGRIRIIWIA
ncbi:hypothetical protein AAEX63_15085 [Luteococcus sp. H138]|uniref:hypothetical protein n=1 Tax=unclassified Luteococcus TaxID=2639923 RepID=UPI00313E578E